MPKLSGWSVKNIEGRYTLDPFDKYPTLCGMVTGHSRFPDKSLIATSSILYIDVTNSLASTVSGIFELGEPDPDFVSWMLEQIQ